MSDLESGASAHALCDIEEKYAKLDHALGGEIEPRDDMTLPEVVQYLVNQRERIDFMIKTFKKIKSSCSNIDERSFEKYGGPSGRSNHNEKSLREEQKDKKEKGKEKMSVEEEQQQCMDESRLED